ncbi:hypothetical protein PoB_000219100 [Plakobranchus ocellatus]|uniref:Uncharacterized protein n=1 Tax=Plakobranchus ocellatus TaxID=259542 RepID=A0AAV3Y051_9GAST|nr:hypothetical protein PoB_000219100 [Plakobranchus ocellatus]
MIKTQVARSGHVINSTSLLVVGVTGARYRKSVGDEWVRYWVGTQEKRHSPALLKLLYLVAWTQAELTPSSSLGALRSAARQCKARHPHREINPSVEKST